VTCFDGDCVEAHALAPEILLTQDDAPASSVPAAAAPRPACGCGLATPPAYDHHVPDLADLPDQVARTLGYGPRRILDRYFETQMTWYLRFEIVGRLRAMPVFRHLLHSRRVQLKAHRLKGGWIKPESRSPAARKPPCSSLAMTAAFYTKSDQLYRSSTVLRPGFHLAQEGACSRDRAAVCVAGIYELQIPLTFIRICFILFSIDRASEPSDSIGGGSRVMRRGMIPRQCGVVRVRGPLADGPPGPRRGCRIAKIARKSILAVKES
jgi:hypothetical protein